MVGHGWPHALKNRSAMATMSSPHNPHGGGIHRRPRRAMASVRSAAATASVELAAVRIKRAICSAVMMARVGTDWNVRT